jgi:hypothetical protein
VVAACDIKAEEEILRIPNKLMITYNNLPADFQKTPEKTLYPKEEYDMYLILFIMD